MAAEVQVKTLNSGPGGVMVFDPSFVKLAPDDRIEFMPKDKGHNAELIEGMAPEGVETLKTVLGREEVVEFDKPGVCGIKCSPHDPIGMVALVVVGDKPDTIESAKVVPHNKLAAKRFHPLFAQRP